MFYQIIVFVLLTAAGFLICKQLLKISKLNMKKNIKNLQTEKEKTGKRLLNRFVMPLVKLVARLIPLDPAREAKMASLLWLSRLPAGTGARGEIFSPLAFSKAPFRPERQQLIRFDNKNAGGDYAHDHGHEFSEHLYHLSKH